MSLIRGNQRVVTAITPHNGNRNVLIPLRGRFPPGLQAVSATQSGALIQLVAPAVWPIEADDPANWQVTAPGAVELSGVAGSGTALVNMTFAFTQTQGVNIRMIFKSPNGVRRYVGVVA